MAELEQDFKLGLGAVIFAYALDKRKNSSVRLGHKCLKHNCLVHTFFSANSQTSHLIIYCICGLGKCLYKNDKFTFCDEYCNHFFFKKKTKNKKPNKHHYN